MDLNWDTEEVINWIWNETNYKTILSECIHDELRFYKELSDIISDINKESINPRRINHSLVDGNGVYSKFCELLEVPSPYKNIDVLEKENIQFHRNKDCDNCNACFSQGLNHCAFRDEDIEKIIYYDNDGNRVELTDRNEIEEYLRNEPEDKFGNEKWI